MRGARTGMPPSGWTCWRGYRTAVGVVVRSSRRPARAARRIAPILRAESGPTADDPSELMEKNVPPTEQLLESLAARVPGGSGIRPQGPTDGRERRVSISIGTFRERREKARARIEELRTQRGSSSTTGSSRVSQPSGSGNRRPTEASTNVNSTANLLITGGMGSVEARATAVVLTFVEDVIAEAVAEAVAEAKNGGNAQAAADSAASDIGIATATAITDAGVIVQIDGEGSGFGVANAVAEAVATVIATAIANAFSEAVGDLVDAEATAAAEISQSALAEAVSSANVTANSTGGTAEAFSMSVAEAVAVVIASALANALSIVAGQEANADAIADATTDVINETVGVETQNESKTVGTGDASADTTGDARTETT